MDVEQASASIAALIDKRAAGRDAANFEEMAWKASVRRHHEKLRRQNQAAWHEFYSRLACSLRGSADHYDRKAEALLLEETDRGEGGRR